MGFSTNEALKALETAYLDSLQSRPHNKIGPAYPSPTPWWERY